MNMIKTMITTYLRSNLILFGLLLGLIFAQLGFADNSPEENIEIDLKLGAIAPMDSVQQNEELLDVLGILASEPIPKTPRITPPFKQQPLEAQSDFRTDAPQSPDDQQPPGSLPPSDVPDTPPSVPDTPPSVEPPGSPVDMPDKPTDPDKPSGNGGNIPPIIPPPIEPPPFPVPPPIP